MIPAVPAPQRLDLAGEWKLEGEDEDGAPVACPAAVPGDVHGALLRAGQIPDPFFGRNERDVQWVARKDWTFTRPFDVPAGLLAHGRVVLRLEDCDTFATVFVNGVEIGETHDRFRRWDFDAKPVLRAGRNEIRLAFRSASRIGDARAAKADRPYPMSCSGMNWFNNGTFIRKPACHRGWDWGLSQMTTGPCGEVALLASDGDRIDYVFCDQDFSADHSHCRLRIHAILENGEDVVNSVEIDDPPLWWPNGQGEQRFFEYSANVRGRTLRGRIGLRRIELDTDFGGIRLKVNGRQVFAKGANWIPCDAFAGRQTPERYRDLLESARDANMNMIRLWGGGQFEKDCFYDLCDELGLLVWHDFMFSCAVYPSNDGFLADVGAETEHQVRRLRDHACIALWCGDNECLGAARSFYPERITPQMRPLYVEDYRKRLALLDGIVRRRDPARTLWPSSPSTGAVDFGHDGWHEDGKGDIHLWTVWHENKPFSDYYGYRPRFCSEFGYQSFPSPGVARTFCPPGRAASGSEEFEWHQKNVGGNDRIRESIARLFGGAKTPDDVLWLSQIQQAIAVKTAVESWRPLRPHCMGTLYWQLNDLWPVSSWSSLEYGGKWKHLHYQARRFYAPLAVVAKPSPNGSALEFWCLNDTAEPVGAEVRLRLFSFGGTPLSEERIAATLPSGSATPVGSRALSVYGTETEREGRFLGLELLRTRSPARGSDAQERVPSVLHRNEWFFAPFKDCPVPDANISVDVSEPSKPDGFRFVLSTDAPAFFVWLEAPGVRGEFNDNSFTLLPGEPRAIAFAPKDPAATPESFQASLAVTHLRRLLR